MEFRPFADEDEIKAKFDNGDDVEPECIAPDFY